MKNTKLRKEEGITLVALVITIVVLLILAAVAIVALSGENNIITKAQEAKENYNTAGVNEEVKLTEYSNEIDKWTKDNNSIVGTYYLNGDSTSEQYLVMGNDTVTVYTPSPIEMSYAISGRSISGGNPTYVKSLGTAKEARNVQYTATIGETNGKKSITVNTMTYDYYEDGELKSTGEDFLYGNGPLTYIMAD